MNNSETSNSNASPLPGETGLQAIILAGGFGTRLKTVVSDLPKCMAPVAGKPFLYYVIDHLQKHGVKKFIFSLGYMSEAIQTFLQENYPTMDYQLSIEDEPLGTGGAIYKACAVATEPTVLALNGDTLFSINVQQLLELHRNKKSSCTICLKPMQQFDRYGVVKMDANNCITSFEEKKWNDEGLINGGVYAVDRTKFLAQPFAEKFSMEKDYLELLVAEGNFYGLVQDAYFIDIGIPEDFERAQKEIGGND
jgi:D-glycero-alpha-D-manno-heptose 1-phosphate guanylyltransferase